MIQLGEFMAGLTVMINRFILKIPDYLLQLVLFPCCLNTGIYTEEILSQLHRENEFLMLYPGFSWTEETIRQHTIKLLKEVQIKAKENFLKEDFNDQSTNSTIYG